MLHIRARCIQILTPDHSCNSKSRVHQIKVSNHAEDLLLLSVELYQCSNNPILTIRRDKVLKHAAAPTDTETDTVANSQTAPIILWHYKLKQLSPVKVYMANLHQIENIGKTVSNRIEILKMLNNSHDLLDGITIEQITESVVCIAAIKDQYDTLSTKTSAKWIENLKNLNIKQKIETNKGRKQKGKGKGGDITTVIDTLAFNFIRFDIKKQMWMNDITKQIECCNNAIIKLKLGNLLDGRFHATLTTRVWDYKHNKTRTIMQGSELFDLVMAERRKFKKLLNSLDDLDKQIQNKRKDALYCAYLIKTSEEERCKRHKKSNKTKYKNRKAKAQAQAQEQKEEEKASEEETKQCENSTEKATNNQHEKKQTNNLDMYFNPRKRKGDKCNLNPVPIPSKKRKCINNSKSDKLEMSDSDI
eukprot:865489_1